MAGETLEERSARLQALRLAAELSAAPENDDASEEGKAEDDAGEESEATIRFRNYVPRDESLQSLKVAPPKALKFDDPVAEAAPDDSNGTEDPIVSIAPRKANWDLRRDVAKKLEKLERRTERALLQLMQDEEKRRQAANVDVEEENGTD